MFHFRSSADHELQTLDRGASGRYVRRAAGLTALLATALAQSAVAQSWPDVVWARGGHAGQVHAVAASPDGLTAASVSADHTIKTWRLADGRLLKTLRGGNNVQCLDYSNDGQRLLTGDGDGFVRIWRLSDGAPVFSIDGHAGAATGVAFSPDETLVASSSDESTNNVKIWRVSDGALLRTVAGHSGDAQDVAFSPDGQYLASSGGNGDRRIRLWRVSDGSLVRTFNNGAAAHSGAIPEIEFSQDGLSLVSCGYIHVKLWTVSTGALSRTITLTAAAKPLAVAYSPDGQTIAVGAQDDRVRRYNAANGALQWSATGPGGDVRSVAFSPDGQTIVSGDAADDIYSWRASDGALLVRFTPFDANLVRAAMSADGLLIATAGDRVHLFNTATGALVREHTGGFTTLYGVALSPNRQYLAAVGLNGVNGLATVWRTSDGGVAQSNSFGFGGIPRTVTFSPDSQRVACGINGDAYTYRVSDGAGAITMTGHAGSVQAIDWSPDGLAIATGSADSTVKLWRSSDGVVLRTLSHGASVGAVAFSPDSQTVASGADNGQIKLWRASDGALLRTIAAHATAAKTLRFTPGGAHLISGGADEQIKFWRVSDGALFVEYDQETEYGVQSLAITADGQSFSYCRSDRVVVKASSPVYQPPAPGSFNLSTPADSATCVLLPASFAWTPSQGADSYTLTVDDDPAFGSPEIEVSGLVTTAHQPPYPLAGGETYYWRVEAVNAAGSTPSTPASFSFTTIPPPSSQYEWIAPVGGAWSNSANWSPALCGNGPPGGANVTIGYAGPGAVNVDVDTIIGSLALTTANAGLMIPSTTNLLVAGPTLDNDGTITVVGNGLRIPGGVSVGGSGDLVLVSANLNYNAGVTSGYFTHGVDHAIRGSGRIWAGFVNHGTVQADVNGQTLYVNGTAGSQPFPVNDGTLKATNGGVLELLNGFFQNAGGELLADGGTVRVSQDAEIVGGTLASTGASAVELRSDGVLRDVTNLGTLRITEVGGGVPLVYGPGLSNAGRIVVISGFGVWSDLTLDGAGELIMQPNSGGDGPRINSRNNAYRLTHGADHWIHGEGSIAEIGLVNWGRISADVSGEELIIGPGSGQTCENRGVLEALNGSTLQIRPIGGGWTNQGQVWASAFSTIDIYPGLGQIFTYRQISGETVVDGALNIINGAYSGGYEPGPIDLNGGVLSGNGGVISASELRNAGSAAAATTLSVAGDQTGTLQLNGDYRQSANGVFRVDVGTSGTLSADRFYVSGMARLGGTIQIVVPDGFTPVIGNEYNVLSASWVFGTFANVEIISSVPDLPLRLCYSPTTVRVIVGSPDAAPGPFELVSPFQSEQDVATGPLFGWTAATGATVYLLVVDDDQDFSSPEIIATSGTGSYQAANGTLEEQTNYYWTVIAFSDCASTYSTPAWQLFTTGEDAAYPGDVDGDGDVDLSDLALLLASFGACSGAAAYNAAADFDGDGCVSLSDLAILLASYGTSAP